MPFGGIKTGEACAMLAPRTMSDGEPSSIKRTLHVPQSPLPVFMPLSGAVDFLRKRVNGMKMALYRKWRPKRFEDVVGQSAVVAALRNQIKNEKFSHAYIFTGIRGIGKTTFAKILAKAVNCPNAVDGEPCGECFICKGIDDGSILDVTEIDAASNNGVDNIRDLRDETAFAPTVCRLRVYIIDEVHMLSTGAFNALLKTLEEPPAHVMFILATTEIHKVPPTILSRCQRFDLKRITAADIKQRLLYVAKQENIDLKEDGAELISRLADGAMRDALSLLDTCASLGGEVDAATVSRLAGVADKSYLFDITRDIKNADTAALFSRLNDLYRDSLDATRLCTEMLRHTRNMLMLKVSSDAELNDCSAETAKRYKAASNEFSVGELIAILDALGETADKLSKAPDKMLALELCFIKLCGNGGEVAKAVPKPVPKPSEPRREEVKPAVSAAEPVEEKTSEVLSDEPNADAGGFSAWGDVVKKIMAKNMALYSLIVNSNAYVTDKHLLIDADELLFKFLRENAEAKQTIKDALFEVTGQSLPIGPYKKDVTAAKQKNDSDKKLDDLINRAKQNGVETEVK